MKTNRKKSKKPLCCTVNKKDSKVKIVDNGKKVVFINEKKNNFEITRVDGCYINEGKRCDFFVKEVGRASVFVEMKGKNIEEACQQLKTTIQNENMAKKIEPKNGFLVICSRVPGFDTYIARYKEFFATKYKSGFRVIGSDREVRIGDLVEIREKG